MVNDPNDNQTYKSLKKFSGSLPLTIYTEKRRGRSYARNMLLEKARGEILAFLDDDCIAEKSWLKTINATFERKNICGIIGRSENYNPHNPVAAVEQSWYLYWKMKYIVELDNEQIITESGAFDLRNAAFRRNLIKDLKFPRVLEEDIAFGHRLFEKLNQQKYKIIYCPEAVVYHQNNTSMAKMVKRRFRLGANRTKLLQHWSSPDKKFPSGAVGRWLAKVKLKWSPLNFTDKIKFIFYFPLYPISRKVGLLVKYPI